MKAQKHIVQYRPIKSERYPAGLLWLLTFLFSMRVLGQVLQRWLPQNFLPPVNAFQGSSLPYGVLLSAQIVILALMIRYAWRVQTRVLSASRRAGNVLAWSGSIYMLLALCRIVIGLALPAAPAWFSTWIPAIFHLVLAAYVLTLSGCHRHFLQEENQL